MFEKLNRKDFLLIFASLLFFNLLCFYKIDRLALTSEEVSFPGLVRPKILTDIIEENGNFRDYFSYGEAQKDFNNRNFKFGPLTFYLNSFDPKLEVAIKGQKIPLMMKDYLGGLIFLYNRLFLKIASTSIITIRAAHILLGLFLLFACYYWIKRLMGKLEANLFLVLFAIDFNALAIFRTGYSYIGLVMVLMAMATGSILSYFKSGDKRFFYLFAFSCGWGIHSHLIFLWYLTAILISLLALRVKWSLNAKNAGKGMLLFFIPLIPNMIYMFLSPGTSNFFRKAIDINSILKGDFIGKIFKSFGQMLLSFTTIAGMMDFFSEEFSFKSLNYLSIGIFLFCFIFIFKQTLIFLFNKSENYRIFFALSIFWTVYFAITLTYHSSSISPHHFTYLIPFFILIKSHLLKEFSKKKYFYGIVFIILLILASGTDIWKLYKLDRFKIAMMDNQTMQTLGGIMIKNKVERLISFNKVLEGPLEYYTDKKIDIIHATRFLYSKEEQMPQNFQKLLKAHHADYFLFLIDKEEKEESFIRKIFRFFPKFKMQINQTHSLFLKTASEKGFDVKVAMEIHSPKEKIFFRIYQLVPQNLLSGSEL